jgi:hypothetical protein
MAESNGDQAQCPHCRRTVSLVNVIVHGKCTFCDGLLTVVSGELVSGMEPTGLA